VVPGEAGRRLLERAAEKVGGLDALAERIGLNARALKLCIDGREPIPEALYLRAVDIVLGDPSQSPP
jgi:hypothetical protein